LAALALVCAVPAMALTTAEILDAAPASDWAEIAPDRLMVMDLAPDSEGKPRQVLIQLMEPPLSVGHVANIQTLARAHWWDGTSVNRVQDNYVVQWGDATEKKPLPPGLATIPESAYTLPVAALASAIHPAWSWRDTYAVKVGFVRGFPVASDGARVWPTHCYGLVGVGRSLSPDTGSGAELYVTIGHARPLDRNIAVVGRVVKGIEYLSALPRGTGTLGFYEDPAQRVAITRVRLASDLPAGERPRFKVIATESKSFAQIVALRANRKDDFFFAPAGAVDVCNTLPTVRQIEP
jgi:cyclophilin family peptidyl-prolyl cis-trans isomerase